MGLGEIKKKTKETYKDIKEAAKEPIVRTEKTETKKPAETKTEETTKTPTGEHHVEKKTKTETEY
jgi:hypothetical protein